MTLISVIMGVCYQRAELVTLDRAVRSILEQTYRDFEFLICEYGSTQEAKEYLRRIASDDDRVKLINGTAPGTLAQNLNKCLANAKGQYIARMDDDDYSYPDRFEKQINYLERSPNVPYIGSNVALVQDGTRWGERILPVFPEVKDFYITQPYIHPSLMFRKEILKGVSGYSEGKHQVLCEDYDLLLRLYANGKKGTNLQEILLDYSMPKNRKRRDRTMGQRWNEVVTRFQRYKELGVLSAAWPYTVKPIIVGLMPASILEHINKKRFMRGTIDNEEEGKESDRYHRGAV